MMDAATIIAQRAAAVAEARSWLGTPFRDHGGVKGSACDCLHVILESWRIAGALRELTPEEKTLTQTYEPQWHLHDKSSELYLENFDRVARRVDAPQPGDAIVYHPPRWMSLRYSCAALVIEWPTLVVESIATRGVILVDPSRERIFVSSERLNPLIFFSPWPEVKE